MMDPVTTNGGESDMINVADIKNDDEIRPTETEQDDEIGLLHDRGKCADGGVVGAAWTLDDSRWGARRLFEANEQLATGTG